VVSRLRSLSRKPDLTLFVHKKEKRENKIERITAGRDIFDYFIEEKQ